MVRVEGTVLWDVTLILVDLHRRFVVRTFSMFRVEEWIEV